VSGGLAGVYFMRRDPGGFSGFRERAVEGADDGLDRGELDVGVDAGAEERVSPRSVLIWM
jgi:hypothetical protein